MRSTVLNDDEGHDGAGQTNALNGETADGKNANSEDAANSADGKSIFTLSKYALRNTDLVLAHQTLA